jgi:hypothetical protein
MRARCVVSGFCARAGCTATNRSAAARTFVDSDDPAETKAESRAT